MKKIIGFICLSVVMWSCTNKSSGLVELSLQLKNIPAQKVYLTVEDGKSQSFYADSVMYTGNGPISLKAKVYESSLLNIVFPTSQKYLNIISDGEKINIEGDLNDLSNIVIKGSVATTELFDFYKKAYKVDQNADSLAKTWEIASKTKGTSDSAVKVLFTNAQKAFEESYNFKTKASKDAKNGIVSFMALQSFRTADERQKALTLLDSIAIKHNKYSFVKNAYATIMKPKEDATATQPASTTGGTMAKEIVLPDVDGKPVTLSSFKGKYVLVDFWASWCGPCRAENPNVVAAYNKFKDKNFTILGVSLDKDKAAWTNAIATDKLTWTHVSDLKYWQNQAAIDYNVRSIPFNFLVNPKGEIIKVDLRGADLHTVLESLLK